MLQIQYNAIIVRSFLVGVFFHFLMLVLEESRDDLIERNSIPSKFFARGYLSMYQRNEHCSTHLFLPTSNEAYANHDSRSTQARLTVEQHTAVFPRPKLLHTKKIPEESRHFHFIYQTPLANAQ